MAYKKNVLKSEHLRMTSVMVEPEIYSEFIEIIPRSKSVAEALREYMRSVVEENRKIMGTRNPNRSAISDQHDNNNTNEEKVIESNLDKFFPSYIMEWKNFKNVVESLDKEERIKLTEIWLHNFKILELVNTNLNGKRHYPFLKWT